MTEQRCTSAAGALRAGGAAEAVAEEVDALGRDAGDGDRVARRRRARPARSRPALPVAVLHDEVVEHVPVEVAERARAAAAGHDVDALVSVGGGSTTGLAKAVALTTGLPIVAVPTTYAGSEATDVWGLTEGGRKTTGVDPRVLPRAVVYDASLTLSLPVRLSVASGLNALAHCVDSMWAPRADPIDQALAREGIRALAPGLPRVVERPGGARRARADAVRRLPGRRRLRLGRLRAAPQDLPRARRDVTACRTPRPTPSCCRYVLALNAPARPTPSGGWPRPSARRPPSTGSHDAAGRGSDAPRALRDLGLDGGRRSRTRSRRSCRRARRATRSP